MSQIDEMVAVLCDEVASLPSKKRLEVVGNLATYLIEFAAYDIARNHNSADSVAVFIIAADFERRMRSLKEVGKSGNFESYQRTADSLKSDLKVSG